jgi:hypothetical protein
VKKEPIMPHILVEYVFETPKTDADVAAMSRKLGPCLVARDVVWQATFIAQDRRRQLCIFKAADAQTVRDAFRSAGVGFERAWAADSITPGT